MCVCVCVLPQTSLTLHTKKTHFCHVEAVACTCMYVMHNVAMHVTRLSGPMS